MNGLTPKQRKKSYHSGMALLAVLIVLLVNLIADDRLGEKLSFDISSAGLYTLTAQSVAMADRLTEPVALYLIAERGKEDTKIKKLLSSYAAAGKNISVDTVDPVLDPLFVSRFTDNRLENNSVIVASGKQSRVLKYADIYVSYYDTSDKTTVFDGEGKITAAIRYVSGGESITAYALTGHEEQAFGERFSALLAKEMIEAKPLSLLRAGKVPDDAELLVINAPLADLNRDEAELVGAYLERGGRLLLLTVPGAEAFHNLNALLQAYGVGQGTGVIVEADANHYVPTYPTYLIPTLENHEITGVLITKDTLLLQPQSHPIETLTANDTTLWTLTAATNKAYTQAENGEKTYGPFSTAVAVEKKGGTASSRIVWIACANMILDTVDGTVNGNNSDFVLNAVEWAAEREQAITVRPKLMADTSLQLTSAQVVRLSVLYVGLLPLAAAVLGVLIHQRRKKRG